MEIFGIGLPEILLIAVVALIILGPDRLPSAARTLGKGIADFRKALEPARDAWSDVTREFNDTIQGTLPTTTVTGEPITGNPWKVHPLAEGLTDQERETYFATGELPKWKLDELDNNNGYLNGNNPEKPGEPQELDYPMPHNALAYSANGQVEELYYPEPTHQSTREETG